MSEELEEHISEQKERKFWRKKRTEREREEERGKRKPGKKVIAKERKRLNGEGKSE